MLRPEDYMTPFDELPYSNFAEWLAGLERRFAEHRSICFRSGRAEFDAPTYRELALECRRVARGLLALGLERGDRVVLWAENRPEWMIVWLATVIAGCTIVPVDFLVSEDECRNIASVTRAKAAFFSAQKAEFAAQMRARLAATIITDDAFRTFGVDAAEQALPQPSDIAGDAPCSIVFTSGTTGFAKGVVLSHRAIIANVNAAILALGPGAQDTFVSVLPLHHTYPTTCSFLAPLSLGIRVVIVERLVGQMIVDDIRDSQATFIIAVPLLYEKLMLAIKKGYRKIPAIVRAPLDLFRLIALRRAKKGRPEFGRRVFRFIRKKAGLSSLRMMVAGGGPLNPATADFFDSFGFNIVQGYGMSENSPLISVNTTRYKDNRSVGLRVKDTDVRIVSPDDDTCFLPTGAHGEIVIKSPSLMLGYYENPEATAEMFSAEGFLKTGDLGYINEDGFIFINGRKKNLIVSAGGKNIYPEEIENRFNDSQVVGEILVLGRKNPEGESVFAIIHPACDMLRERYPKTAEDPAFVEGLVRQEIERVNRTLPAYKKISTWVLRDSEFEKNAQKKIRRFLYGDYADPLKTPIVKT